MDKETRELLDRLNRAFDDFKNANDERLKKIENGQSPDTLLVQKMDRANADISAIQNELKAHKESIREAQIAASRIVTPGSSEARDREIVNARQFFSLVRNAEVQDVTDADVESYRNYRKAFWSYIRHGDQALRNPEINAALSTGAGPEGGFWLTPDTSGKTIEFMQDISSMRRLATIQPIGTDTWKGSYDLDEADSGWVGERQTRAETNTPRIDDGYTINVHEQYANPRATQKQLDDSFFDVETWLAKKVATKLAKRENAAFTLGDGVLKPKGFLTYAAGTPARTSVAAYRKIQQIITGVDGGFKAAANGPGDCFIDIITAVPSELRAGAKFVMNQLTLAEVRKIKDTEGRYIFIPDFAQNPNGNILGYGIEDLSDMPDIAADSLSIAFGNFAEAYLVLDHVVGMRVLRDPFTAKPYIQYYTTKRVGGDVVNFQALKLLKFGDA